MKLNLNLKHYILFIIIILVCIYQQLKTKTVEGYQSYDECVNQGYPLDFCLQVPVQAYMGALPVG